MYAPIQSVDQSERHTRKAYGASAPSDGRAAMLELLQTYSKAPTTQLRNRLVQQNLGLVHKVAHQFARQCYEPYEDLVQVGVIGLIRAIERFDACRGHSFSSFAIPYIRGEMQHYLRDRGATIRVPRRWLELDTQGRKIAQALSQSKGCTPREQEVATMLAISEEEWRTVRLARRNRVLLSLDAPVNQHEDAACLVEFIPSSTQVNPSLSDWLQDPTQGFYYTKDDLLRLQHALDCLEASTRDIIRAVFFEDLTQTEAARRLGISPMTVSRRIKKGIQQLWSLLDAHFSHD